MKPPRFHIHGKFSVHEVRTILAVYRLVSRTRFARDADQEAIEQARIGVVLYPPQVQTLKKLEVEMRRIEAVYEKYLLARGTERNGALAS